jgi:hypothetical protein
MTCWPTWSRRSADQEPCRGIAEATGSPVERLDDLEDAVDLQVDLQVELLDVQIDLSIFASRLSSY